MTSPEPTVNELRERIAACLHMGLDGATPNSPEGGEEEHRAWVARVQEWADWIHEQYKPHLRTTSTSPEQSAAEKAAAVWWGRATGTPWSVSEADPEFSREGLIATAHEWIDTIRAAGLAVVELPEPTSVTDHPEIGLRRAIFGPIRAQAYLDHLPDTTSGWEIAYYSQGFATDEDVDPARFRAARRSCMGETGARRVGRAAGR